MLIAYRPLYNNNVIMFNRLSDSDNDDTTRKKPLPPGFNNKSDNVFDITEIKNIPIILSSKNQTT